MKLVGDTGGSLRVESLVVYDEEGGRYTLDHADVATPVAPPEVLVQVTVGAMTPTGMQAVGSVFLGDRDQWTADLTIPEGTTYLKIIAQRVQ